MYKNGQDVIQNDNETFKCYKKAVDLGDRNGLFKLGIMYQNGKGVTQNNNEAFKCYKKTDDLGHPDTLTKLNIWILYLYQNLFK